jgi:hypothetical protein
MTTTGNRLVWTAPRPLATDPYVWAAFGCGRPRYRWAEAPRFFDDVTATVAAVRAARDGAHDLLTAAGPRLAGRGETLRVEEASSNRTRLRVTVTDPHGAWLIDNTGYHPGWAVTVDGVRREPVRANLGFMAVHLPRGARSVTFEFTGGRSVAARRVLEPAVRVAFTACLVIGAVGVLGRTTT